MLSGKQLYESLVLLKRQLCLATKHILFLPVRNTEEAKSDRKIPKNEEYDQMLIKHYSTTFHKQISNQSNQSFFHEVVQFKQLQNKVARICSNIRPNDDLQTTLLSVPQSRWHNAFTVTSLDCLLMKMHHDVFRNIFTIRQYPELCTNFVERNLSDKNVHRLDLVPRKSSIRVHLNSAYCSVNRTNSGIPVELLNMPDCYHTTI